MIIFGALKKHATGLETLDEEQSAAAFLLKADHDFKQTMIEINILGAFAAIAFIYDIRQNPCGLFFDEEKFRQSPGFANLRERDAPLWSVSKRRREVKFECTNKPESIHFIQI
jgi:hypothetical protein